MLKTKNCIVSVAVREPYTTLQKRFVKSLEPFSDDFDMLVWTDEYPEGSPALFDTYYAFKVYAIKETIKRGYTNILWLDAACYALQSPKPFFDIIEKQGYYFTGNEDILSRNISDYYLDSHNIMREEVKNVPLPSGSIYGFNIESKIGLKLFMKLSSDESYGFFMDCYKDDSARIDGRKIIIRPLNSKNKKCDIVDSHRHDEACLAYHIWNNNCHIDMGQTGYFQGTIMRADKNIGAVDFVIVDEHTFDKSLLHKTSKVLDCGCRGFAFSKWIAEHVKCPVVSIDADPEIEVPSVPNITYINAAVTNSNKEYLKYYSFGNGTGNYTEEVYCQPGESDCRIVETYKIQPFWDLIKMDIEGSEYDILMNMTKPLARQISVEFHEHTPARKGQEYMDGLFRHMSQWYNIYNEVKEKRHGCEPNYWDVLFILKDGIL